MSETRPWLSTLGFLGFSVNWAIEHGYGDAVSFDDLYNSLEKGTLLEDLNSKIPNEFDFSLFPTGSEQNVALNQVLNQVAGGLRDREARKLGIEKSGLHLLLGFILEAMQQQDWVLPEGRQHIPIGSRYLNLRGTKG